MYKDGTFIMNDISESNIASLEKQNSVLAEKRICELSTLAREAASDICKMVSDGYGIYEILSVLSELKIGGNNQPHSTVLTENSKRVRGYLLSASISDKVVFTELLLEYSKKYGFSVSESDFLDTESLDETFTYVKNPLSDEAYDVFSQDFSDPRVSYSQSFKEACKKVSEGDVEYCLLPLEERGGARLRAIAELLFRTDLKICSVTPVFGLDGIADVKYALVSKHFNLPLHEEGDDRYLEIRLNSASSLSPAELFAASEMLSLKCYRINNVSFETEDGREEYYSVVFKTEEGDFSELLTFLTLYAGTYTPVGIYKNLE